MIPEEKRKRHTALEQLENRELLAADLPTGVDLVTNGDFESLNGEFAVDWVGSPLDVDTHEFAARPERGHVAYLPDGSSASQTVQTITGQTYLLTFDFRVAGENKLGSIQLGDGGKTFSAADRWQTVAHVIESSSSSLEVKLEATGDLFVDCVQLIPVEKSLITNGSFEDTPTEEPNYFKGKDLAGWNAVGDPRVKNINLRKTGGSDGDRFLNVDGNTDWLDRIVQRVKTEPGSKYFVSFDIKTPENEDAKEGELRVRWNNQFAGAFVGGSDWSTVGFFADSDSPESRLLFREVGAQGSTGNGNGPYIDNVMLFQVMPGQDSLSLTDPNAGGTEFIENNGPVELFSDDLEIHNSVFAELTGAVVKIQNPLNLPDEERLSVDAGDTGIKVQFDPRNSRLRLSGAHSVEDYQQVLRTLTYENRSEDPDTTPRNIRVSIDYGTTFSKSFFVEVEVNAINDRPEINPIADQSVTVLTTYSFNIGAFDAEDPDNLEYTISSIGSALGIGDPAPEISDTGEISWIPQQSGTLNVTVTATDPEGLFAQRAFTITAELNAPVPDGFVPFSGARQLSNVVPSFRDEVYSSAPGMNIDLNKEYRAIIETDDGQIEILLYDNETPITVNSFVNLARDGYYDGLGFHRVTSLTGSFTEGFIAQGGDPLGTGTGGPGYNFADENLEGAIFDKPVIAMANRGKGTASNGSQFFLTYDDKVTHLNGNHTIFGEIVAGMDVVNQINKRNPGSAIPAEVMRKVIITES